MGTSASPVDIWNRALSRIGETERVESETSERQSAAICRIHWDDLVKEVLGKFPWSFARKQVALAQTVADWDSTTAYAAAATVRHDEIVYTAQQSTTGDNPEDDDGTNWAEPYPLGVGWDYIYTIPTDCISPLALLDEGERTEMLAVADRHAFSIFLDSTGSARLLGCNLDTDDFVAFEYTALVDHIPLWPAALVSAITFRLAAELALAIPKDSKTASAMMSLYERAIFDAYSQELSGHQPDAEPDTPSLAARG